MRVTDTGVVKFFNSNPDKRFGFIQADNGGGDIFFHLNQCDDDYEQGRGRIPQKGDRVELERNVFTKPGKGPTAKSWRYDPYVSYHDICHGRLGTTSQVGAYYVGGLDPYPNLSEGIRFQGTTAMFHSLRIHKMDVEIFVARVKKWEEANLRRRANILAYVNETKGNFFFSSRWQQPDVPDGFAAKTFRLPMVVKPHRDLPDGIIVRKDELVLNCLGFMREIPNPNPEYQPKDTDPIAPDGGRRADPESVREDAKPAWTLQEAEAYLADAKRYTCADLAFGDAEIYWKKGEVEVASGYRGSTGRSVCINGNDERDMTTFEDTAASALLSKGIPWKYKRNDSLG